MASCEYLPTPEKCLPVQPIIDYPWDDLPYSDELDAAAGLDTVQNLLDLDGYEFERLRVRFVRFTITSNQTPDFATNCPGGAFSGCSFTDLTELEVFGS